MERSVGWSTKWGRQGLMPQNSHAKSIQALGPSHSASSVCIEVQRQRHPALQAPRRRTSICCCCSRSVSASARSACGRAWAYAHFSTQICPMDVCPVPHITPTAEWSASPAQSSIPNSIIKLQAPYCPPAWCPGPAARGRPPTAGAPPRLQASTTKVPVVDGCTPPLCSVRPARFHPHLPPSHSTASSPALTQLAGVERVRCIQDPVTANRCQRQVGVLRRCHTGSQPFARRQQLLHRRTCRGQLPAQRRQARGLGGQRHGGRGQVGEGRQRVAQRRRVAAVEQQHSGRTRAVPAGGCTWWLGWRGVWDGEVAQAGMAAAVIWTQACAVQL